MRDTNLLAFDAASSFACMAPVKFHESYLILKRGVPGNFLPGKMSVSVFLLIALKGI